MHDTHIVATFERLLHVFVHVVVVERHEQRVDYDTQGDEQLHERIEHQQSHVLLKLQPQPTAVPHTEEVYRLHQALQELLLERGPILIVFRCWEVVHWHCCVPFTTSVRVCVLEREKQFLLVFAHYFFIITIKFDSNKRRLILDQIVFGLLLR